MNRFIRSIVLRIRVERHRARGGGDPSAEEVAPFFGEISPSVEAKGDWEVAKGGITGMNSSAHSVVGSAGSGG